MKAETLNQRYKLNSRIGQGGFGAVYKATDLVLNREVAVKVLNITNEQQGDLVQRFITEAQIASKLKHPNTMTIYDFGKTIDQRCFLVSELLVGQSLHEKLANGKLSLPYTLEIIYQVSLALQEAHQNKIVHRDIKPANIYLNQPYYGFGFVKLLDFGIAKLLEERSNTMTGQMMGTPHYMSPEQIVNIKLVDHKTDIYSLGIVIFHCLMGRVPFNDESYFTIMKQQMIAPLPKLEIEGVSAEILADVQNLLLQMTTKDQKKRIQTIDDVIAYIAGLWEKYPSLRSSNPTSPSLLAVSTSAPQVIKPQTVEAEELAKPLPPIEQKAKNDLPASQDDVDFDQILVDWQTQHSIDPIDLSSELGYLPTNEPQKPDQLIPVNAALQAAPIQSVPTPTPVPVQTPAQTPAVSKNQAELAQEKKEAIALHTIAQMKPISQTESKLKLWLALAFGILILTGTSYFLYHYQQTTTRIIQGQDQVEDDLKSQDQEVKTQILKDQEQSNQSKIQEAKDQALKTSVMDQSVVKPSLDQGVIVDQAIQAIKPEDSIKPEDPKNNQTSNLLPDKTDQASYQVRIRRIPNQAEYEIDENIKIIIDVRKNGKSLKGKELSQKLKITYPSALLSPVNRSKEEYRLIRKGKGDFKACVQDTCETFHIIVDSTINDLTP